MHFSSSLSLAFAAVAAAGVALPAPQNGTAPVSSESVAAAVTPVVVASMVASSAAAAGTPAAAVVPVVASPAVVAGTPAAAVPVVASSPAAAGTPAAGTPAVGSAVVAGAAGTPAVASSPVAAVTPAAIKTPAAAVTPLTPLGTPVQMTTSTVYATQLHTITSCAPEVTNCPARSGTPAVVTSIVAISTTVCPVTAAGMPTPVVSAAGVPVSSSAAVDGVTGPSTPVEMTVRTVYATQLHTVTSCAPEVTNCPARSGTPAVVTSLVPVGTTSVPVSAAAVKPSSAAGVPFGTGSSAKPTSDVSGETAPAGASLVTKTSDATLTYTLGTGTSATVVTTTVKRVSTETQYSTVYAHAVKPSSPADVQGASVPKLSTIQSTSTQTKYMTVVPVPSGTPAAGTPAVSAPGSGKVSAETASPDENCSAHTVTVTKPAETVYVTLGATAPTSAPAVQEAAVTKAPMTTSTVYTTMLQTYTSDGEEQVVTRTVALYTTVCPVTATATGHSVAPLQSNHSAYYPTPSNDVAAAAAPAGTGVIAIHKAKGGAAAPSGFKLVSRK